MKVKPIEFKKYFEIIQLLGNDHENILANQKESL